MKTLHDFAFLLGNLKILKFQKSNENTCHHNEVGGKEQIEGKACIISREILYSERSYHMQKSV